MDPDEDELMTYSRTEDAQTKIRLRKFCNVVLAEKFNSLAEKPPKDLDRSPVILILNRKVYDSVHSLRKIQFSAKISVNTLQ